MMLKRLFSRLFRPSPEQKLAYEIYGRAVTWARSSLFYSEAGVEDSLDGRFDMILLHMYILLHQLRQTPETSGLQQAVQEAMVADMDRTLRELGVGDMSVGKQVKNMAAAWLGRSKAFDTALESELENDLEDAIARNIYRFSGEGEAPLHAATMARYMKQCMAALQGESGAALAQLPDDWPVTRWQQQKA